MLLIKGKTVKEEQKECLLGDKENLKLPEQPVQFIESKITILKEVFEEQEERDTENLNKIKREIQNTQDILNDLSRVLEKPKKTYQFYHKHL